MQQRQRNRAQSKQTTKAAPQNTAAKTGRRSAEILQPLGEPVGSGHILAVNVTDCSCSKWLRSWLSSFSKNKTTHKVQAKVVSKTIYIRSVELIVTIFEHYCKILKNLLTTGYTYKNITKMSQLTSKMTLTFNVFFLQHWHK